ncbi:MAG: hypothetical protein M1818_007332 [Claussenomyces sp. TS43310]|nr:MAG: hypothetical protein M1818_007332 [Claussenomyces sp. TS43310]
MAPANLPNLPGRLEVRDFLDTSNHGNTFLSISTARVIINYTQYAYPIVLFVLFLALLTAHGIITSSTDTSFSAGHPKLTGPGGKPLPHNIPVSKKNKKDKNDFSSVRRLVFAWLSVGLAASFVASAANVLVHALAERKTQWWCGEATVIYIVASGFLYSLFLISIVDSAPSPTIVHLIIWAVALIAEALIFGMSTFIYTSPHEEYNSLKRHGKMLRSASQWEIMELCCDAFRLLLLLLIVGFYMISFFQRDSSRRSNLAGIPNVADERTPLLGSAGTADPMAGMGASAEPQVNGNANGNTGGRPAPDEQAAFYRPTTAPSRNWWEYLRGYSLFFPYLWPSGSLRLQLTVVICFVLVLLQRAVNLLVPYQIGVVTNKLMNDSGEEIGMPWLDISLLILYKLVQGSSGLLNAARSILWIPVAQYSYAALTTASFEHVHGLSLEFHLGKRTGEVLSALSKGAAINTFLEQVTFQVLPMLLDLGIAIAYLVAAYDTYYALTLTIVTFWYLYVTIRLAQWRAEQRRAMINADREEDAVKNDSIQSYETVKYFGAEVYEFKRYRDAVRNFQKAEYSVTLSLSIMNVSQNMVFMVGLLVVAFIAAYQVTTGQRQVGAFVALITYMAQLQQPLNFFGTFYRSVQSAMISGERLLELFKEQPTVVDEPDAAEMSTCEGQIRFDNVRFSYDERKPALEKLSFTCLPGTTTALVGESGGGKSTIFRLLFRFYNFQGGSIQLDGHDVRDVTIKALRSHIGVVPQDTVLFNETLMYNLRYANQDATDEQIFAACRAASIHDKIMAFPDQYQTKVGERGLRLSGGEKQRVAIARTILKNPRIIMLDEATAALDSETEQNIQEALRTLSEGRTMLVIAHRLSTITQADQILVLHQGCVVEAGTHEELLAKRGRYASMWKKQIRAEQAAEEARVLNDRAAALREASVTITRPNSREGFVISEEVSESDGEQNPKAVIPYKDESGLAGRALGRAAESLRGAASLVHSQGADNRNGSTSNRHP